jgi:hypothetical protein
MQAPVFMAIKLFPSTLTLYLHKLERLFKSCFVEQVLNFWGRPGAYPQSGAAMSLLTNIRPATKCLQGANTPAYLSGANVTNTKVL